MRKILVWDWPVRIGHWLLAAAFCIAWLTAESESGRLLHVGAGAMVLAIVSYRLLWGFIGSTHARFRSFIRGPESLMNYLDGLLQLKPQAHTGHNPAGGWAIVALLALGLLTSLSGWLMYEDIQANRLEDAHEILASILLGIVFVHLAGVVVSSLLHRENLPRAMLTGRKEGTGEEAIASTHPIAALALLVWVAGVCWYITA